LQRLYAFQSYILCSFTYFVIRNINIFTCSSFELTKLFYVIKTRIFTRTAISCEPCARRTIVVSCCSAFDYVRQMLGSLLFVISNNNRPDVQGSLAALKGAHGEGGHSGGYGPPAIRVNVCMGRNFKKIFLKVYFFSIKTIFNMSSK